MQKVSVVGSGYVGLVAGTCLADIGANVICVDNNKTKIENLKKGIIPIYEPGLKELIIRNSNENRLSFTTDLKQSVKQSKYIFIAVGTPPGEDGSSDLQYVIAVANSIGKAINENNKIIIIKSTVPVGTADLVKKTIRKNTKYSFSIVSNPEFLKEGAAIDDFMKPDRIVVGVHNKMSGEKMKELYSALVRTGAPIYIMDNRSAEMTKYAANSLLATRISFMNEMANLCERVGADITNVRIGIGSDKRIGRAFLFPGVGFGGSCFPKDVNALVKTAEKYGIDMNVIKAANKANELQKQIIIPKVLKYFNNNIKNKKIAIWGLSFKARTDDMREAPSIVIINELLKNNAKISVFDPEAMCEAKKIFKTKIKYGKNMYEITTQADALIIVTDWNEFRRPDFDKLDKLMKEKVIFDGRNLYDTHLMKHYKFKYYSIGRKPVN